MAYVSPFKSSGSTGFSTKPAGFSTSVSGAPGPVSSGFSWGGSSSSRAANSYDQGPPDRLDLNAFTGGAAQASGFNLGGVAGAAAGAGLQALEVAGKAPGFIYERPAATAQAALKFWEEKTGVKAYVPIVSEVLSPFNSLLGAAGDALTTLDLTIKAGLNATRVADLQNYAGHDPDEEFHERTWADAIGALFFPVTLWNIFNGERPKTVGEFREQSARLGYTEQDIADVSAGRKTVWDFGDRAMSENPLMDMAASFALAPTTWAMFATPALALTSRITNFSKVVKAGIELEQPLARAYAAEAVAKGVAKEATWEGVSAFAQSIARGELLANGSRALELGKTISGIPLGSAAVSGATRAAQGTLAALSLNKKAGLALTGAELVGEVGYNTQFAANTPLSGFLEPFYEMSHAAFNNRPMSDNVAFMIASSYFLHYGALASATKTAISAAKYRGAGSMVPARMIEAFAEGQKGLNFAAKKTWVYERFGGEQPFNDFLGHVYANIAFRKLAPELEKTYSHFASLDEAALKVHNLSDLIVEQVKATIAKDGYGAADVVKLAKEWYGARQLGEHGLTNPVKFSWNGERAIDQWRRYTAAANPIGQVMRDRVVALAGGANLPLPVLQLSKELSREELSHVRLLFGIWAKDGKVANEDVRKVLDSMPQLLDNDKSGYWNAFLTDQRSANVGDLAKRLKRIEKDAPTVRAITDPAAKAEASARAVDPPIELGRLTDSPEPPTARLTASRFSPSTFGVEASVTDAIAARGSAQQAAVAGNVQSAMTSAGFDVTGVRAVVGADKGTNHLELVLGEGRLEEMRAAATIYGRAVGAMSVTLSVTGEKLARLALKPNGLEVIYQLPSSEPAVLDRVGKSLAKLFPDLTINPETGHVRALVAGKDAADLSARLRTAKEELTKVFPMDNVGETGVSRSTNPAYFEKIGRNKASSDASYQSVKSSTGHLPQWSAEDLIKERVSRLDGVGGVDRLAGLRSAAELGRAAGGDGPVGAAGVTFAPAATEDFVAAITAARAVEKKGRLVGETVYQYSPEEYASMRTYLSPDGKTGYALKSDGDLVSVFNVGVRGAGSEATAHAVTQGAKKLDAFDESGFLPDIYGKHGFKVTERQPWNPEYAPEGWTGGTPDVVYMTHESQLIDKAPADIFGIGDIAQAKHEPGYIYHATPQANLPSISDQGLRVAGPWEVVAGRSQWAEGGVSKRLWYSDTPDLAAVEAPLDRGPVALLRVKQDAAGALHTTPDGTRFTGKNLHSGSVEVFGKDGAWHSLDTYFENPMADVPTELAASHAAVAGVWESVPVGNRPDNISAALRYEGDVAAAARAGSPAPEVDAIHQAVYDAQVAMALPQARLFGAYATAPEIVKAELEAFNRRLRSELPGYEIGASPKVAWVHNPDVTAAMGALKMREGLGLWLATDSPLAPLTRMVEWLTHPEANVALSSASRNTINALLIQKGATPGEVEKFYRGLREATEASKQTMGGLKAHPQISALPAVQISDLAANVFKGNKAFLEAIGGPKGAYKLLDQASNRFIRGVRETAKAGGQSGYLSRLLDGAYRTGQNTPVVKNLRLIKVYYHLFRFMLDPRWHAMNLTEADILGALAYGEVRHGQPTTAATNSAFRVHAGSTDFAEMGANTGWYFPRNLEGIMQRSFDHIRPDAELGVLKALEESDLIALWKHFPDASTPKDLAKALDEQLYNFDSIGVKATLDQKVTAYSTELGRDLRNEELAPILQRLYEVNDAAYRGVINTFEGNVSRTNLERLMNSYFLYWPLSYQLKAGKWMVDVLTKRIAGKETGAVGAYTYSRFIDAHREAMADKSYADVFDKAPTLWFFAQMLFPITPGDLGVSLSRGVRYTGSFLKDVTGGDEGPLGFFGSYAKAEDPMAAAFAITNMGPIYTWNQTQKALNEGAKLVQKAMRAPVAQPSITNAGLTMSDFTDNAGTPTP